MGSPPQSTLPKANHSLVNKQWLECICEASTFVPRNFPSFSLSLLPFFLSFPWPVSGFRKPLVGTLGLAPSRTWPPPSVGQTGWGRQRQEGVVPTQLGPLGCASGPRSPGLERELGLTTGSPRGEERNWGLCGLAASKSPLPQGQFR